MSDMLKNTIIFVAGIACGAVAADYILKTRYEERFQEWKESVKEVSARKSEEPVIEEEQKVTIEKPSITEYASMIQKKGYTNYSDSKKEEPECVAAEEEDEPMIDRPYVIPPEDFGEYDDYEQIELTYYSDEILADENDELVEDINDVIGIESLNHFGEYEDDSVFVRNDRLKADYQILLDNRRFVDVRNEGPNPVEE